MRFLVPSWLWGLLAVPVLYGLLYWDENRRQVQFAKFADRKLWKLLSPELNFGLRRRKALYWVASLGFIILALARPQWGSHQEIVQVSGLDVMLVLDLSNSMSVEDVVPSRLQKAKHLIRTLLGRMEGDRVGLVGFAASTWVVSPLTSDLSYIWDRIETLTPKSVESQGTDMGLALETAQRAMERGAQEGVGEAKQGGASHVVILISDGEDHENDALTQAAQLKERGIKF
jgi:Ca-activated chloride channel family protein